ncbi:MAG: hypothetical protein PHY54_10195 [Methylococcales bacterium]|nr:hypothetical protein [Methylococcales bacterium]
MTAYFTGRFERKKGFTSIPLTTDTSSGITQITQETTRMSLKCILNQMGSTIESLIKRRKINDELLEIYKKAGLFILVLYAEPENFEGFGYRYL